MQPSDHDESSAVDYGAAEMSPKSTSSSGLKSRVSLSPAYEAVLFLVSKSQCKALPMSPSEVRSGEERSVRAEKSHLRGINVWRRYFRTFVLRSSAAATPRLLTPRRCRFAHRSIASLPSIGLCTPTLPF